MTSLPGFGFTPSNDQIIDYVKRKRLHPDFSTHMIKEIDIYSFEPWDLLGKERVLYIFSTPNYKYNKSKRHHRRTREGYWKITGQGSKINAIGSKRILSFHYRGSKTEWVMHEFYVEDDPRYKKDFVMCRIERKRDSKPGIPTNDEGQSNQHLVSDSSEPVPENTILEAVQHSSNNLVSNRKFVTENIFQKTQLLPSDPVNSHSRNQGKGNTFLDSQQLSSDHLISSSRNHVAENSFPESQPPSNNNVISCSGNHVAENSSVESPLPPNHNRISCSQLPQTHNMISYSRNHVEENSSPDLQQLSNHSMIPYNGNYVAENGSLESQQLPNHKIISFSELPPNHNTVSYSRSHVAENASAESPLTPDHNMISCSLLSQGHNMISYSGNHVEENGSSDLQQLSNPSMIPYNGNYVAENGSLESQQLPNLKIFLQLPPNHNAISYSRSHVAENASAESQLPLNHNLISCSQVPPNYDMISCSQLPPNQNMVSYPGNHVEEDGSLESQQLPNPNMISYYGNRAVGNGSLASQLLPNHNMVSDYGNHVAKSCSPQLLLNHTMISHNGNHVAVNAFNELQQLLPHNLISNRNHIAEVASQEVQPIGNYSMISCSGNHIAENAFPESQQVLPNCNLISYPRNQIAENTFKDSQLIPNQYLELLSNQCLDFYSMNNVAKNTSDAKPLPFGEPNAGSDYSGVTNASFSAQKSPIYSEQGSSYTIFSNNSGDLLNSQFGSKQVNYPINLQRAFQNESSSEETGQTHIPHFNSPEPDTGVDGEDGCDMDIDASLDELSKILT